MDQSEPTETQMDKIESQLLDFFAFDQNDIKVSFKPKILHKMNL